jgi:hypothetical protein
MFGCNIGTVVARSDISDKKNNVALGRVKVLIRGVSDISGTENFTNPLGSSTSEITNVTSEKLKNNEVWAYVLQPNHGGSLGIYDIKTNEVELDAKAAAGNITIASGDHVGPKQGTKDTAAVNPNNNDFAGEYKNNAVNGTYSIPPVGATVVILYINGKRGLPVVIGTIHSAEAIASIYEASEAGTSGGEEAVRPDYPGERK